MADAYTLTSYRLAADCPSPDHDLSPADAASAPSGRPPPAPAITTPSPSSRLPPVTTGTSELYVRAAAAAVTSASLADPLNLLFLREVLAASSSPPLSPPPSTTTTIATTITTHPLYALTASRLRAKLARGSRVVEASRFAAVACWEPLSLADAEPASGEAYAPAPAAGAGEARPAWEAFAAQVRGFKRECVDPVAGRTSAGGRSWHVCLTARDPGRERVDGAVRAVLVPFMRRVTGEEGEGEEGEGEGGWERGPVWLEASNERARDVYAHFGFRLVREMETMGVRTYGMMYTGNLERAEREGEE